MAATNLLTDLPMSTTDRVVEAWSAAHAVTRRGVVAAMCTTVLVSLVATSPNSHRFGLVIGGSSFVAAALVDVHEHKLPNRLVALGALAALFGSVATADHWRMLDCLSGALVAGGAMLTVRLCRGVGMGDVKMAAAIGASVGPLAPVAAPFAIAVTATLAAGYGALARRSHLALGPALWFGWASAVVAAAPLGRWWS